MIWTEAFSIVHIFNETTWTEIIDKLLKSDQNEIMKSTKFEEKCEQSESWFLDVYFESMMCDWKLSK